MQEKLYQKESSTNMKLLIQIFLSLRMISLAFATPIADTNILSSRTLCYWPCDTTGVDPLGVHLSLTPKKSPANTINLGSLLHPLLLGMYMR